MTQKHSRPDVDVHVQNSRQLSGRAPASLRSLRTAALARFQQLGLPSTRLEDWKYTSVAPLSRQRFSLAADGTASPQARDAVQPLRFGTGNELVFINGHHSASLSTVRSLPTGTVVGSLATTLATQPALIEPHLARYAHYETEHFTALNTAFVEDGAFVYLPKGAIVDEPIHLLFVSLPAPSATITHPRNLIVLEETSQATVVEDYVGVESSEYWTNAVTEVCLAANAGLVHYKLQRESERAFHVATISARQAADSRFTSEVVSVGSALARNDVATVLDAPGSECVFDGLYLTSGKQHVDHHTTIDHQQPHCTSRELYKGVLDGRSTAVFNGKVFVRPNAQKSDAQQMNKNLLLSEEAVINTKPQLEIFADDVKCSHGAAIGRLDDEALYYLRARGIGEAAARRVLIRAFANELINRITVEPLREQLDRLLSSRLQDAAPAEVSI